MAIVAWHVQNLKCSRMPLYQTLHLFFRFRLIHGFASSMARSALAYASWLTMSEWAEKSQLASNISNGKVDINTNT